VLCDDGNACTTDSCDPSAGCQVTNADGQPCDDSDACTDADACLAGACNGTRVCGPDLPSGGTGGNGGSGAGGNGELPMLAASRKGIVKLTCLGPKRSTCAALVFAAQTTQGGELAHGDQVANRRRAKIGKKGQVVLKIKLNKAGRNALAAADNQLPVFFDTTVTERDGTTRQSSVAAIVIGKTKKK